MSTSDPVPVFRALHQGRDPGDPLVLPGPWDAASARTFEQAGFPALATPSAAVAASLGYEDGLTPAAEMFAAVARIVRSVSVPVSADIEAGYGLAAKELVERLLETGAVGCNLEDSVGGVLLDPHRQADRLAEVRSFAGDRLFVNARVDTYLLGGPDLETGTIERGRLYATAGADCVYPITAPPAALPRLAAAIPVPLNAHGSPHAPQALRRLGELGATRITFGPLMQQQAMRAVREMAGALRGP
ncbi:isocitrate lyase/phosphoenolpyruvate mutase family protein [Streptomyces finlayi]|uniref:Isocitrate lyase/phosphoenolpyruvate mutase family protein n=1 Tax=Streptomyces finlayi TaxID=67296 RepID=A0A7G7BJF4_9ACTN|nr:isocitrate lyase/phosphoenolpyruvate mutase family protein [Streptomyces finlayi]QNE75469.1 isocitrate lyase/phosphoenolpyruvate mutase family protein [Streptomyces finlayi]